MTAQALYLGIDIGGTNIKSGLVDKSAQITNQDKRKTPQNLPDLKLAIIDIVNQAQAQVGDQLKGVGFLHQGRWFQKQVSSMLGAQFLLSMA